MGRRFVRATVPLPTGVGGDGTGQALGEISIGRMEGKERQDRSVEVLDVISMGLFTSASVALLPPCVPFGGPLGVEAGTNPVDGRRRCPHAS